MVSIGVNPDCDNKSGVMSWANIFSFILGILGGILSLLIGPSQRLCLGTRKKLVHAFNPRLDFELNPSFHATGGSTRLNRVVAVHDRNVYM